MPAMQSRLSQLENRLSRLIEGTFSKLFAGTVKPRTVVLALARAMDDAAQPQPNSSLLRAPSEYIVHLHPDTLSSLTAREHDLGTVLANELVEMARELNLVLPALPVIALEADPTLAPDEVAVSLPVDGPALERTSALARVTRPAEDAAEAEPAVPATLIVDGERHIPLEKRLVTVGRQTDNVIIVDDARVSRHHVQLRQRFGRWVLYDLGSSGGTWVNGTRVSEYALKSGDVISLAGAMLIYVEDATGGHGAARDGDTAPGQALPRKPASNDEP